MNTKTMNLATLGGGCFWCTEAIMNQLEGVTNVVSGYAGGETKDPTYRQVTNGNTGHAEVVQVSFDPAKISYEELLIVFLTTHNPTTLNKQGADIGAHYRSIILFHSEEQQSIALATIKEIQSYFDKAIVTEVVPFTAFYQAEVHHQDYYRNNPERAYCQAVISPKLKKLRALHSTMLKKQDTSKE